MPPGLAARPLQSPLLAEVLWQATRQPRAALKSPTQRQDPRRFFSIPGPELGPKDGAHGGELNELLNDE